MTVVLYPGRGSDLCRSVPCYLCPTADTPTGPRLSQCLTCRYAEQREIFLWRKQLSTTCFTNKEWALSEASSNGIYQWAKIGKWCYRTSISANLLGHRKHQQYMHMSRCKPFLSMRLTDSEASLRFISNFPRQLRWFAFFDIRIGLRTGQLTSCFRGDFPKNCAGVLAENDSKRGIHT